MPNTTPPRHIRELLDSLANDPAELEKFKADPITALAGMAARERHPFSDALIYRLVVFALGSVILLIVGGELFLYINDSIIGHERTRKVPEFLIAACSTSIGALAGLLAPIPNTRQQGPSPHGLKETFTERSLPEACWSAATFTD